MKIGVIGSGVVGQTLGAGFLKHGHETMVGSREPAKLKEWAASVSGAKIGTFSEAAKFGDAVVLAVQGSAATDALNGAGKENIAGKPVMDACNPISGGPEKAVLPFFTNANESLMERLQRDFPDAKFVKAFNSVGSARMIDPTYKEGRPTMFICGNDAGAKQTVSGLLSEVGWDAEDMGGVEAARAIEPLCILWCIPGFLRNEWGHAFKLLKD